MKALTATLGGAVGARRLGGDDDNAGRRPGRAPWQQRASDIEVVTTPPEEMTVTEPLPEGAGSRSRWHS